MKDKIKNNLNKIIKLNNKFEKKISVKPFKYVFQFLPNNIFILLLFIFSLLLFIPQFLNNEVSVYSSGNSTGTIGEIFKNEVKQEIAKNEKIDNFDSIKFFVATFKRKNTSNYRFELLKNNDVIYKKVFNSSVLEDNEYFQIKFNSVKKEKNEKFYFKIVPIDAKTGNAITVYCNKKGQLTYKLNKKSPFTGFCIVLFIIFLLVNFFTNYLLNNKKIKNNKNLLLILLIYIVPISILIPAYQAPDEQYHFYRAYNLSTYDFTKLPGENLANSKINSPSNIKCLRYSIKGNIDNVTDKGKIDNCLKSTKNKVKTISASTSTSSVFAYIMPAIGIKIADIFTNSPMILFYIGRLINLFVAMFIIYCALKILPISKKIYLLLFAMPVFVQQMCSYSYDSILNALCLLLIAYVLRFIKQKEKISKKQLLIYCIISFLIFEIKLPYGILSALILIVPKDKFHSGKVIDNKLKKIILIFTFALIGYLLITKLNNIGYSSNGKPVKSIAMKQITFLLNNPKFFVKLIYNTFANNGIWYLYSMVGIIGWLRIKINYIFVIAFYILFLQVALSENSILKRKQKILILICILIIAGGIFAVMYLSWSTYKLNYVNGVQGRYFIPLLIPFIMVLLPKKKIINLKNETVYSFVLFMLMIFVFTILVNYY